MEWVDTLRGIAILAVVLFHSQGMVQDNTGSYPIWLEWMNDSLRAIRMPLLMFLSGLLLPVSLRKSVPQYLAGKLAHMGWPYLVWSFALLGLLAFVAPITGKAVEGERFLRVFYDPPTYLWYLAYLLIFYVVALIIPTAVRPYLIGASLAAVLVIGDGKLAQMVYLFAFFLLGELFARTRSATERFLRKGWVLVVSAALSGAVLAFSVGGQDLRYEAFWAPAVGACIVIAMFLANKFARTRVGAIFARVGRRSIVFYVTHWALLLVTFHLLNRAGLTHSGALALLVPTITVAVGFATVWTLSRWPVLNVLFVFPRKRRIPTSARTARQATS